MIGKVTWPGGQPVMILHEDHTWTSEPPGYEVSARAYQSLYADAYQGPQDGPYGPKILHDLASRVGGTVWLEPKPSVLPPGTVY